MAESETMVKQSFDYCFASVCLLLLIPVIGIVSVLVRVGLGTPVLFRQQRPGLNGKLFMMYKFRSMVVTGVGQEHLVTDEERLTPLGSFLRSTSLDELPELYNVLRGEMSLVGPRPLLVEYLDLYTPEQARRHEVKPGITGWAQVNGRNAIDWEEKFNLDVWYVDNQSFWLDMKICFLTVLKMFSREGVNQPGEATTKKFKGSATQDDK